MGERRALHPDRKNVRRGDMDIIERRDVVVEMYRQRPRPSFRAIAQRLGVSEATVTRDYREAMLLTTEHTAELADQERAEQLDLTQQMLDRIVPRVLEPRLDSRGNDLGPDLDAAGVVLKIMERRARVTGSDMPAKVAQTDSRGNDKYSGASVDELRDLAARIAAAAVPAGDGAGEGSPQVHLAPARPPEPIAAEWSVVHMAPAGGPRVREVENRSGDDAGAG
jgi:hypothetical protein